MIHLKHGPCCLQLLPDRTLAVGTYELDDELATVHTNKRNGSLCFVQDMRLISENECEDGGIFDLHHVTRDLILAAHTSGTLSLYQPSLNYKAVNVKMKIRLVEDETQMLTCVHAVPDPDAGDDCFIVCTATSVGSLFLLHMDVAKGIIHKKSSVIENGSKHPVWAVKCAAMDENRTIIFTGSDAGVWNIFMSRSGVITHEPIYSNSDAGSGVTSLWTDFKIDENGFSGVIYTGSYDEHLRAYPLTVTKDERVNIQLKQCLHINGSGIWTIRPTNLQYNRLLVSGMYSGFHLIDIQSLQIISSHIVGNNELIYDAIMLNDAVVSASFYAKRIHIRQILGTGATVSDAVQHRQS